MRRITAVWVLGLWTACGGGDTAVTGAGSSAPAAASGSTTTGPAPRVGAAGSTAVSALPASAAPAAALPMAPTSTPAATTPAAMPPSAATPALPASAPAPAMAQAPVTTPASMTPAAGGAKLAMDECGLHTKYKGDEYCILPPPPDKGFQLHIGPKDYDNPEPQYVMQPGEENVVDMNTVTGNDKDVYYFYRQYRMRPGSHHVILSVDGRRIGGIQNLARDEPNNGMIPPEDEGVGLAMKAHTSVNVNMHFYNFGEKPIIRELWVNYWYKDPAAVKETTLPIYAITGVSAAVAHSHVVVGATCQVMTDGRVLDLYGHRHLSNVRFSAWHTTGGKRELILDDYDAEHPSVVEFNSLVKNPAPNPMGKMLGAHTGILQLKAGDTIDFDCEIVNKTDKNFFGANEAQDDEMCIMIGNAVGAQVPGFCAAKQAMRLE